MQPFEYSRPASVADALGLLASAGAKALAGGTDLITDLREGRHSATRVVDLKHIPELVSIERDPVGGWRIGAAASLTALASNAEFCRDHPGLVEAAGMIGSLQIQSRATLGGNLCTATPSADALPLLICLGTEAEIANPVGRRLVPVADVLTAPRRTALAPTELVTAFYLPPRPPRSAARYLRFTPRREMDIAIAGAGAALSLRPDGAIAAAAITLAAVAPVPLQAKRAEARLVGATPSPALFEEVAAIAAGETAPISDTRASADYRRHLAGVLTRRALEACMTDIHKEGQIT